MCIWPDTLPDYVPKKKKGTEKKTIWSFIKLNLWYTIIGFILPPIIDIYHLSATLVLYGMTPVMLLLKYIIFRYVTKEKK